jgi:hypothetical protein
MTARFLLDMRAWDSKSSCGSQDIPPTRLVRPGYDPGVTDIFTRGTIGRNILTDFGNDPVVPAQNHGSERNLNAGI